MTAVSSMSESSYRTELPRQPMMQAGRLAGCSLGFKGSYTWQSGNIGNMNDQRLFYVAVDPTARLL